MKKELLNDAARIVVNSVGGKGTYEGRVILRLIERIEELEKNELTEMDAPKVRKLNKHKVSRSYRYGISFP